MPGDGGYRVGAAGRSSTWATMRPGRSLSTRTRSARKTASAMLWVTMRIVCPCPAAGAALQVEPLAGQGVQLAERFVHEQQLRLVDERACQHHALVHPAGELAGIGMLEAVQAHQLQQLDGRAGDRFRHFFLLNLERKQNIFESPCARASSSSSGRQTRCPGGAGEGLAVEPEPAAIGRQQAADDAQEGALAAAGRAQQADELARGQAERDRLQRLQRPRPSAKALLMFSTTSRSADIVTVQYLGQDEVSRTGGMETASTVGRPSRRRPLDN